MADAVSAFDFLSREKAPAVPAVCVLFGDEPLLKRESLDRLRAAVLSGDDAEMSLVVLDGNKAELREVFDELATVSMFGGGRRMIVVDDADDFVSAHRSDLEDYCDRHSPSPPGRGQGAGAAKSEGGKRKSEGGMKELSPPHLSTSSPSQSDDTLTPTLSQRAREHKSVLVLQVDSWPANTRLYKRIAEMGLQINCNLPKSRFGDVEEDIVLEWLAARAEKQHSARLGNGAGEMLLEIVGPELGRLDQELAKLALLAVSPGPKAGSGQITRELVEQTVGGWRAKTAWTMIEAALDGNAAQALVELDRLLLAGEEPIALLAMMSGSLRRLAAATRIIEQADAERRRISLPDALREAGVAPKKFVLDRAERQLRQITRQRGAQIYNWLLEADLALKGPRSSGQRARLVLEELIVRLSQQAAPKSPARSPLPAR